MNKELSEQLKKMHVRECHKCTALIADHPAWGRQASIDNENECACCAEQRGISSVPYLWSIGNGADPHNGLTWIS